MWRLASYRGHVGVPLFRRRSNGFEASHHYFDHVGRAGFDETVSCGQMACWWLGFGGFPTLSLWITQVRGYKFCDGIVKGLRREA